MPDHTVIALREHEPRAFDAGGLSAEHAETLWRDFGTQVSVEYPSPRTDGRWVLRPSGWVGLVPLGKDALLALEPKVPLTNVFRMLEYAYRMDVFRKAEHVPAQSISEMYESLARILARRIRDRTRRGLHRIYVSRTEDLSYVRGRMDLTDLSRGRVDPRVLCHFEEHTLDHEDNQILLYTLHKILRSGLCSPKGTAEVRASFRALRGAIALKEFTERDVTRRTYHRLNHDYQGLHALCRFFLAHTGPTHQVGDRSTASFLVNMPQLFEAFVAAWLGRHLPQPLHIQAQESGAYDVEGQVGYRIDLVLYGENARPLAVLDTKYKRDSVPSSADVAQVVSYATKKGCAEAVLIYPWAVKTGKEFRVGPVRVRSMGFPLEGEIDASGRDLVRALTARMEFGGLAAHYGAGDSTRPSIISSRAG